MFTRLKNFLISIITKSNDRNIFTIGSSHLALMRQNYHNIKDLNELDYKIYSQAGEDGIIDYLLHSLKIKKPKFVELGVGDYWESNTRFVFERTSCKGLIVDNIENFEQKVMKNIKFWKGNLTILKKEISSNNVLAILANQNFDKNLDLFSIDIDGIDYWVLEKLENEFSKIVVAEYNPYFGSNLKISVPNIESFKRKNYHYSHLCFGASLKAIISLLYKKGYIFLGTNLLRSNAFFVLKKFKDQIKINLPDMTHLDRYVDSNIRESRNKRGELNYLSGSSILKQIENCEVMDLTSENKKLLKVKEVLN